jgi:hypothetical protein
MIKAYREGGYQMQNSLTSNKILTAVITLVLWLATAAVGLWQIALIRELLFRLIARFSAIPQSEYEAFKQAQTAGSLGILLLIVLAVVWIAVFIGGAEYLYRHAGKPRAWKLFAWIIATQAAIFLLALFI